MEEECARYRCEGEDGSPITVWSFNTSVKLKRNPADAVTGAAPSSLYRRACPVYRPHHI
jgi:hypothetical protein